MKDIKAFETAPRKILQVSTLHQVLGEDSAEHEEEIKLSLEENLLSLELGKL